MGWQDDPVVAETPPLKAVKKPVWESDPVVGVKTTAPPSNMRVFQDAAYEGAAAVPDMLLNTPNSVMNLTKALFGTGATMAGHSDLQPAMTPNPDIVRGALEKIGLIKNVQPQGFGQKALSTLTKGAVGGALTGGASLPGVGIGAGMGALSTGASEATEKSTGSNLAGIAAGLLAPAGVAKVAGGRVLNPDVRLLRDEGVLMTPGEILGGVPKRIEDSATSIHFLGDVIKSAQRRGHETLGRAAMNRGMEPIGEALPPKVKGNEAVGVMQDKLGANYERLNQQMKGSLDGPAPPPANALPAQAGQPAPPKVPSLRDELDTLKQMMAQSDIAPQQKVQFERIVQKEIIDRFNPQGLISGESIQAAQSKLKGLANTFGRSDNYDIRDLGDAVREAQAAMRRMMERENPQFAKEKAATDEGYANFKKVQRAASTVAAPDGVFTPAQLHNAVKAGDPSKDKSKFARGDALMQDLSSAGKNVLSSSVPDSGTTTRALVPAAAAALGGAGGHLLAAPAAVPVAAAALAGMSLYTPWGQRMAQKILAADPRPAVTDAAKASVIPLAATESADANKVIKGLIERLARGVAGP